MSSVADVYRKRLAYPEDADKSLSEIRQERLDNALQIQQDANEEAARQAKEREDKLKKMGTIGNWQQVETTGYASKQDNLFH